MPTPATQIDRASIERQILETLRELLVELGRPEAARRVALDASFERDLGLSSLDLVELLVRCETRLDVEIPEETAHEADTPAAWVRAILSGANRVVTESGYRILPPAREAPLPPDTAATIIDAFWQNTQHDPDRIHIHLLEGEAGKGITYGQLFERASQVAAGLTALGLKRNDTVAIMLPTGTDFFYSFLGTMLAGAVPAPIYPPVRPDQIEEYVRRQIGILRNAEIRLLITFDRVKAVSHIIRVSLPGPVRVTTVNALLDLRGRFRPVEAADIALVQYTSGSTGDPKGVMLSHANVLANIRGIGHAIRIRPSDAVVTWLPLYSDLGLIGSWLFSLYYGTPLTVLSPLDFLSRPERWLWAIHDSKGTLSAAPNFAYELCARRIPAWTVEGLDLSSWRVAVNAGEAVLPATVARFTGRFRSFGLRAESLLPCYGLAESSVALAIPPIDRPPVVDRIVREEFEKYGKARPAGEDDSALQFFSVGRPLPEHEVRIVDEHDREVGERVQGRLLFRGPSAALGYYQRPKLGAGDWIDSGDLAYRADGELYVTGRSKDCIIKAGRNISPEDVEAAASEVPGVEHGGVVAFGVIDPAAGTERLVAVAETRATFRQDWQPIRQGIIASVDGALGIPPDDVVLIRAGRLPKTSNGKLRRSETRSRYLNGRLRTATYPPVIQIARLWCMNLSRVAVLVSRTAGQLALKTLSSASEFLRLAAAGLLFRLTGIKAVVAWAAGSHRVSVTGLERLSRDGGVVFIANRASRLDPLVLAGLLPGKIAFLDDAVLRDLPRGAAFLLRPMLLDGPIPERAFRALNDSRSVLLLPDSPIGAPAHLSRFRLDAFRAACAKSRPIYAIGIRHSGELVVGAGLKTSPELAPPEVRDRVRKALVELCR